MGFESNASAKKGETGKEQLPKENVDAIRNADSFYGLWSAMVMGGITGMDSKLSHGDPHNEYVGGIDEMGSLETTSLQRLKQVIETLQTEVPHGAKEEFATYLTGLVHEIPGIEARKKAEELLRQKLGM